MIEIEPKVKPKCSYFGSCGGCAYQDLEYSEQLELKRKKVEEALWTLQSFPSAELSSVIPSPKPYHYRHMIALTVKRREGALKLGFISMVSNHRKSFIPIESCAITDERINQFIPLAYAKLEELPLERRFRTSQMVLRVGETGEVVTSLRMDRDKKFDCTVLGKKFSYSLSSFFQHNFSILDLFVETIRSMLDRNGIGTLFDLYSGVGFFGISVSDCYEQVFGIEEGYEAVLHARKSAEQNQITNASFLQGKVEFLLPELFSKAKEPLDVIVDPPRSGLKPQVIDCILKLPVNRLVYVSCELSALKRDLELLEEKFEIERIQPLDLFPQTKHIETVVLLKRKCF